MAVPYGKYLLERKLAEGGMAEIFLARPAPGISLATNPGISLSGGNADKRGMVVVKRLFSHHSAEKEFVRMFFNEARLAARLKHPNIVDIFDQGEIDGTYYLAMEFIAGEDLRSIAQQADTVGKRLPLAVVCRIIIDMLAGLHYAHTLTDDEGRPLGLVHRDISPQNVLVTYDGVVKVIDFGIAKATQAHNNEQTQAGLIKGKYAYMSPEQTRSGALDARADVFSAGILLWELVAWRRLFKRASDLATLVAVTEEPAPSMTLYTPDVPKELDDVVLKALAMDRNDRYASAKEFHDALVACVEHLGWDGSREELGRYMRELFQQKLQQERKQEARAALDAERASAMSLRLARAQVAPQSPATSGQVQPLRATMPMQVISPALASAARRAKQQGQAGPSGAMAKLPPSPPPPPSLSGDAPARPPGQSVSRPPMAPESKQPSALIPPTAPSGNSLIPPLPPPPSSLEQTSSQSGSVSSKISLSISSPGSGLTPPPSSASITGPLGRGSDPLGVGSERARSTQTQIPPSSQIRVILAVVLGIVVGVLAVLMLQYLGARPSR